MDDVPVADLPEAQRLIVVDVDEAEAQRGDPGTVIQTCANCGAEMIERKCKLICNSAANAVARKQTS